MTSMKRVAALTSISLFLCACGGGASHSTPTTSTGSGSGPTVVSSPPGGSFTQTAFTCPTSDTSSSASRAQSVSRRTAQRGSAATPSPASPLLAVTYAASSVTGNRTLVETREQSVGAALVREYTFSHTGLITRVVRPPSGESLSTAESALRSLPGVRSVGQTGLRVHATSVNGPYITSDPFFKGLGPGAPLYETATSVDGQWNMHVTRLEYAFAYSQSGNGSGITNAGALGSSAVKIAIIDTGEDPTHSELASKIAYQKCFITNPDGSQSTSNFETDPTGHGTAVSGVAAADTNNSTGFAGAGGAASIYAYRVFPTPDDNCINDNSTDDQCTADSQDIVSSIEDAVAQKANVINLSLGGGSCATAGADPDPAEGNAVADAIADNIVVVAASGNDSSAGSPAALESPACDTGVIAVGATGLSDGQTNATGNTSGSASNPTEYVASYSNVGSPAAAVNSANAWGIVAPGGDALSSTDQDALHWIDTIWTSTPYTSSSSDTDFVGYCLADQGEAGTAVCRTLIDGTSLASPDVAGTAALIIAANSAYQSPTKMKQLLCATADDISDPNEGCGRLDVYRAMSVAVGDSSEPSERPVP
jgi:subtilisin family serine protease